jgi:uncharacterized repeat protein (TIGR03803 family)
MAPTPVFALRTDSVRHQTPEFDEGESMKTRSGKTAAVCLLLVLAAAATRAQTFTVLYSFQGTNDGSFPDAPLIMDKVGNLYGTTFRGGTLNTCGGCGIVFKLDALGNETPLHTFTGVSDGTKPAAGLVMDAAGNLYGTASQGGTAGLGTVFKIDPSGNETTIHAFTGAPSDGASPLANLIMDAASNLYGTTASGGSGPCAFGCGVVFKIDPAGNETVVHNFNGFDGELPMAGLLMDSGGNLYGTTFNGGGGLVCGFGCGVVFKLDPSGIETILYSFEGLSDGRNPFGSLIMDAGGNLYGTTSAGGVSTGCSGCGTVFKIDTLGNESLLYTFAGGSDGANPEAGLIMDGAGNLYGTTSDNAIPGFLGTVFKLDSAGHKTVLHNFTGGVGDGARPRAALIMDTAGNLYGTAEQGGAVNAGIVFRLTALTPQQATQAIIDAVNALFAQGVLNRGQDNSLVKKLQHAINLMNAGDNAGAIQRLDTFIDEVNGLLNAGVLSASQAASLINAANSAIERLSP